MKGAEPKGRLDRLETLQLIYQLILALEDFEPPCEPATPTQPS